MAALSCYQPCRSHLAQPARCLDEEEERLATATLSLRRRQLAGRCYEPRGLRHDPIPELSVKFDIQRTREELAKHAAQSAPLNRRLNVESSWSKVEEVRKKFEGAAAAASYSRSFESPPRRRLADSLFASFKLPRKKDGMAAPRAPAQQKRKSAVEMLAESKAFYVKSETVLDRKQELPLRMSSGLGQAIAAGGCHLISSSTLNNDACCNPYGTTRSAVVGTRRAVSAGEGLQNTLRRLLGHADSRENMYSPHYMSHKIYAEPRRVKESYPERESGRPSGTYSGTSSSGTSGSKAHKEDRDKRPLSFGDARVFFPESFVIPRQRPNEVVIKSGYSIPSSTPSPEHMALPEPPRSGEGSPGAELLAISPPAQYAHSAPRYIRSNSHSQPSMREEDGCTNINSHKSLPDLHTQARCYPEHANSRGCDTIGRSPRRRRHSNHQRTASCSSKGTRSNHSSLMSSCEAFSEHPSPGEENYQSYNSRCGSSFARDSGGSSGHYTQHSAPPAPRPRDPRAPRADSGSSTQHDHEPPQSVVSMCHSDCAPVSSGHYTQHSAPPAPRPRDPRAPRADSGSSTQHDHEPPQSVVSMCHSDCAPVSSGHYTQHSAPPAPRPRDPRAPRADSGSSTQHDHEPPQSVVSMCHSDCAPVSSGHYTQHSAPPAPRPRDPRAPRADSGSSTQHDHEPPQSVVSMCHSDCAPVSSGHYTQHSAPPAPRPRDPRAPRADSGSSTQHDHEPPQSVVSMCHSDCAPVSSGHYTQHSAPPAPRPRDPRAPRADSGSSTQHDHEPPQSVVSMCHSDCAPVSSGHYTQHSAPPAPRPRDPRAPRADSGSSTQHDHEPPQSVVSMCHSDCAPVSSGHYTQHSAPPAPRPRDPRAPRADSGSSTQHDHEPPQSVVSMCHSDCAPVSSGHYTQHSAPPAPRPRDPRAPRADSGSSTQHDHEPPQSVVSMCHSDCAPVSSGHYTQHSAPPAPRPRDPRAPRADSGSSTQHDHEPPQRYSSGHGDWPLEECYVSAPPQFQDGAPPPPPPHAAYAAPAAPARVGIHFQASAPPPQFQDEPPLYDYGDYDCGTHKPVRCHGRDYGSRDRDYGRYHDIAEPIKQQPQYQDRRARIDDSQEYVNTSQMCNPEEVTSPLGTFKRQRCLRYKQRRPRPILRSKSDISDRYRRSDGRSPASAPCDGDESPPSPSDSLQQFFSRLGLETRQFEALRAPPPDSPVFFSSASTVDSNQLPNAADYTVQGPAVPKPIYRNTEPPSVVERNARIIKWLCQCRKTQMQAPQ